ncbi:ras and ef-hand domain-containing protein [Anaeramoeba flamelloides]|uniref:Ras and ef-hand domain-containing protein n=1 Tax=Anaeramoeba flamelloides TaxID=1746091 RepID=A0AAV7YZI6_9EUKA|nr:ras and ef-hand domain-containing protein [Anaeramoeba flamelloides]
MSQESEKKEEKETFQFKIVFLGESAVGKSSVVIRFVRNSFSEKIESTIGATYTNTEVSLDDYIAKLQIWDTAGQERYHSLTPMYYRNSVGAFIVYDVTSADSFVRAQDWVHELRSQGTKNVKIMLLGNKIDLQERVVKEEVAMKYAEESNLLYAECSAKSGLGVNAAFLKLAKSIPKEMAEVIINDVEYSESEDEIRIDKKKRKNKSNKGCC